MRRFEFVRCEDGFGISIQASRTSYCIPQNDIGPYTQVELGFPTIPDFLISKYAEMPDSLTETVYGYVPVGIVKALLIKHGGPVSGTMPPFHFDVEQSVILAEALEELK